MDVGGEDKAGGCRLATNVRIPEFKSFFSRDQATAADSDRTVLTDYHIAHLVLNLQENKRRYERHH